MNNFFFNKHIKHTKKKKNLIRKLHTSREREAIINDISYKHIYTHTFYSISFIYIYTHTQQKKEFKYFQSKLCLMVIFHKIKFIFIIFIVNS